MQMQTSSLVPISIPSINRSLIALWVLICLALPTRAATQVSGIVDEETWKVDGSPYVVSGEVLVSSLNIDPGVEVRFRQNAGFSVTGILRAKGTAEKGIRFTADDIKVGWNGIFFNDSVPGSYFSHSTIEYSQNSGVRITNSPPAGGGVPVFTNCVIQSNSSLAYGGGIYATLKSGDLSLINCLIISNTAAIYGGGIDGTLSSGALKMTGCTLQSNVVNVAGVAGRAGGFRGGGIRISGNSVLLDCIVADNACNSRGQRFVHCGESYGGGVYAGHGTCSWKNCRFERNVAQTLPGGTGCETSQGGGVYSESDLLTMQNCIVASNVCSASDARGAGIIVGSNTKTEIVNCTVVANNTHGIYNYRGTVSCLNSIVYFNNSDSIQIGQDGGTVTASYCDVQGGIAGEGNKSVNPNLRPGTLELLSASPLIDAGNPDSKFDDICFPPTRGTKRNDMGAFGGPGACNWIEATGECPAIIGEPQNQLGYAGRTVTLCAAATGSEPLNYQWRFNGVDIAGATETCLTLKDLQASQAGNYSVRVNNACGNALSREAVLIVNPAGVSLDIYAGLTIEGVAGKTYKVEFLPEIASGPPFQWQPLTNLTLPTPKLFWIDPDPARNRTKYYRVTLP